MLGANLLHRSLTDRVAALIGDRSRIGRNVLWLIAGIRCSLMVGAIYSTAPSRSRLCWGTVENLRRDIGRGLRLDCCGVDGGGTDGWVSGGFRLGGEGATGFLRIEAASCKEGARCAYDGGMGEALPNPLFDLHRQAGAEFQAYDAVQIVSTFGEPQAEYSAIHKGAGLMDQPQRGFIEVGGGDRHSFVNNLVTQQIWNKETKRGLAAGRGGLRVFSQHQGADRRGHECARDGATGCCWRWTRRQVEAVRAAFDKYRFVEKVKISSRVGALHQIALLRAGCAGGVARGGAGFRGRGAGADAELGAGAAVRRGDYCLARRCRRVARASLDRSG